MSYVRGTNSVNTVDGENNESTYGSFSMPKKGDGMNFGVVNSQNSNLTWLGDMK